jgi:hypothetical protein
MSMIQRLSEYFSSHLPSYAEVLTGDFFKFKGATVKGLPTNLTFYVETEDGLYSVTVTKEDK